MQAQHTAFAERLSDVIGLIYETASDESLWPKLLEGVAGLVQGAQAGATALPIDVSQLGLKSTAGVPVSLESSEAEPYLRACLAPHFARSHEMQRALRETEIERDLLERLMDRLPLGVAIVDGQGRAISMNRAMLALLESGAALGLCDGCLKSDPPQALAQGLARVLSHQQHHTSLRLAAVSGETEEPALPAIGGLSLWISHLGGGKAADRAMVLTASPGSRALSAEALGAFFGLSKAEARLTQQLALGHGIDEAAQALGISRNTAKSQLKKVFAKVGVKRQPELVQAIYASPLWLDLGAQSRGKQLGRVTLQEALPGGDAQPEGRGLRLPDGRWLAWSDSGDPQGWPVLMCHGFIGSSIERHPDESHLRTLGIRLIIPERPGCGDSDYLAGRRIGDWPADVSNLLCHLGIEKFSVISWQFGAPYALELSRVMPHRVQALALVSPPAPVAAIRDLRHYAGDGAFLMGVAFYTPSLLLAILRAVVSAVRRNVFTVIDNELRREPACAVINDPQFRTQRARTLQKAAKNGPQCVEAEMMAAFKTWTTDYPAWPFPITVWHGDADPQVHWHAGQQLAALIPGACLKLVSGAGHFLLFSHWRAILGALKANASVKTIPDSKTFT